jgi:hypothetical protein
MEGEDVRRNQKGRSLKIVEVKGTEEGRSESL